jgi:hypothetical protein
VPRRTTASSVTDLGGSGKEKLTGARPSIAAKSSGGDSMLAGRRGGGWCQWSGQRAPGHRVGARGRAGGTERRSKQALHVEALGGGGAEGNRHRWRCTAANGVGGWVREISSAPTGPGRHQPVGSGSESVGRWWCAWRTGWQLFLAPLLHEVLKLAHVGGGVLGHDTVRDKNVMCTWNSRRWAVDRQCCDRTTLGRGSSTKTSLRDSR